MSSECLFIERRKQMNWSLVLVVSTTFFLFIQSTVGRVFPEFPVCCPSGWVLVNTNTDFFQNSKYVCQQKTSFEEHTHNSNPIENITHTYGLGNGQLEKGEYSAIPDCDKQAMVVVTGDTDVELNPRSCVVQVVNRILAVTCPPKTNQETFKLSVIQKCCPINYFYNARIKKCVSHDEIRQIYHSLFNNAVVILDDVLECPRNRVIVEYILNQMDFNFTNGKLVSSKFSGNFGIGEYCIETVGYEEVSINGSTTLNTSGKFLIRTCNDIQICEYMPCIRKCCADGEIFAKGNATSYCKKDNADISFHSFESLIISGNFTKPSVFGILRSLDCRKFRLDPDSYADEAHSISNRDGSLLMMSTQKTYTNNQYCVEKIRNSSWEDQKLYTFLCFDSKVVGNDNIRFKMYPIGLLISCSFYAITLMVYLTISKLRNLPGQILICLVSSLFAAYLGIALGQLMPTSNDDICFASGFFVYFCLMSAFAWMNVMCFDIWQTFGTAKRKRGFKTDQTRKFVLYSMYGWGLPTVFTTCTVSLTKLDVLNDSIKPHFGHGRCWFTYDTLASANLLFFSGPVGVLFIINFVLFSATLRYCNRVKREIFRMQSSNVEKPVLRRRFFMDKARFAMNTKLFIVMGITWLLEILSILFYDHKRTFFWAISDSFNVLLGVFVFFIFVFKRRVWNAILDRFGVKSRHISKNTPNTTCATHSTCAQSMSMVRLNTTDNTSTLLSPTLSER